MEETSTPLSAELPAGCIRARSRRQAMDWSLVLASQGIEAVLQKDDPAHWSLIVDPGQAPAALAAIYQYRVENRGWSWNRNVPGIDWQLHPAVVLWLVALALWHIVVTSGPHRLLDVGLMDSAQVAQGQWWRLFTAISLHRDLGHLAANLIFGFLMLGLAMGRFGAGLVLLATFLAGALGNLAGYVLRQHSYLGLGSSGMMMAAVGVLGLHSLGLWNSSRTAGKAILTTALSGFFLFILFGLSPDSDILAHAGGFLGGLLMGGVLALLPSKVIQDKRVQIAAAGVFIGLLIVSWLLALRPVS